MGEPRRRSREARSRLLIIAMQQPGVARVAAQRHRNGQRRRTPARHRHHPRDRALTANYDAAAAQARLAMDAAAKLPANPYTKGLLQLAAHT